MVTNEQSTPAGRPCCKRQLTSSIPADSVPTGNGRAGPNAYSEQDGTTDSDSSDDQPISQRSPHGRPPHGLPGSAFSMAAAPMAPSAAGPLKRKQPQAAAPPAAKRAKTYLLPPVRGQKCGKCKHCLNPQMKKKCLEVERKQKEELAARDELPLSLMGGESMLEAQRRQQLSNRPGSGSILPAPAPQQAAAMARAQPTAAQIAFQNSLRAVLVNDEIHPARAEDFARLMAQQASNTNSSRKELLLTIVQRSSSPELLAVLVGSGVVDQLHRWLQAARDVQDDKWLASLLAALRHLPMTVDVLGRSSLGKTVNKLTKSLQGPVQEQALALVQQWRAIVSKRLLCSHGAAMNTGGSLDLQWGLQGTVWLKSLVASDCTH